MLGLTGRRQSYDWGSRTAIPEFLGQEVDGGPSRSSGSARTRWLRRPCPPAGRRTRPLRRPPRRSWVGHDRARRSAPVGLLKVIAADRPLSLQSIPRGACRGVLRRRDGRRIPVGSPRRTYRDANHKPEMLVALTGSAQAGFAAPRRSDPRGLGTDLTDRPHRLLVDNPTAHGMRAAFRTLVSHSLRPSVAAVDEVVEARLPGPRRGRPRLASIASSPCWRAPSAIPRCRALLLNPSRSSRGGDTSRPVLCTPISTGRA